MFWVKLRGKAIKADILVGVCYSPPNQDEETDEIFSKGLGEVSRSLALGSHAELQFTRCLLEIKHSRGETGLREWHEALQEGI